jgi:thiosulfate/3-mercaptopyruvate sulfurtransferase
MFPGADAFAAYAGGLGIGSGVRVVAYDGSGTNLSAARAWWMLRHIGHTEVAVLDGGLGKWRAESRPLSSGIETREPARLVPAPGAGRIVTREEVRDALARGAAQVVDVRVAERFLGAVPEPRPGIPSGHMAGAVNFPHPELVSRDGTVIVAADLEARLAARGIDPTRPVVAVCGSGTSACALLLALDSLGTAGHCLYDGSWTEWAGSGMPVASGV